jgi:hypothetical protein
VLDLHNVLARVLRGQPGGDHLGCVGDRRPGRLIAAVALLGDDRDHLPEAGPPDP